MARKHGNNYFLMMKEMVECSLKGAEKLCDVMHHFTPEGVDANIEELHAIEHHGDMLKHELVKKLAKEFITPIEREDIMDIASQIDDVTDAVEDVLLKISMFNIRSVPAKALEFVDTIAQCTEALVNVFAELEDFKKSKTIQAFLVEINRLEELGDALYFQGVRELFVDGVDPLVAISWTEVYACLEKCCDTCEHTADLVEHVIMKNT